MKFISLLLLVVAFPAALHAQPDKPKEEGPRVYMPYSRSRDHMVVGIELPGYHMRYDIAQSWNIFMVLLPNGFDDMDKTPVYFSIDTFALGSLSVKELFEADVKKLSADIKGLKIAARLDGKELSRAGECYGAEFTYPKGRKFPNEVFYFCKNKSNKYAILLSVSAKDKPSLSKHLPDFVKWANAPQIVTNYVELPIPN